MMGGFGQNLGMLGKIPGMKNLAMAKNMQKQLAQMGGMGGAGRGMPNPDELRRVLAG
jgi:signal recognition particle subunit SRP54